ncbi:MAG: CrcB family protein [Candidatus Lokiarchaeota archaeon]
MIKSIINAKVFRISLFGFLGAISRLLSFFILSELIFCQSYYLTLLINITGCLGYGFFVHFHKINNIFRKDFLNGFFGAYTTFAMFELDFYFLFTQHTFIFGLGFLLIYSLASIFFYQIGTYLGKKIK